MLFEDAHESCTKPSFKKEQHGERLPLQEQGERALFFFFLYLLVRKTCEFYSRKEARVAGAQQRNEGCLHRRRHPQGAGPQTVTTTDVDEPSVQRALCLELGVVVGGINGDGRKICTPVWSSKTVQTVSPNNCTLNTLNS